MKTIIKKSYILTILFFSFIVTIMQGLDVKALVLPQIEFGKVYTASVIKGDDDERRFQVKLSKSGYIDIKIGRYFDTTGDEGDFYISLIGQDLVTYIDKMSTSDVGNKTADYNNIRIGLKAGTYNLSFEPSFYMSSGIAAVNYKVDFNDSDNFELEKNDTKITAMPINTNRAYYGMTTNYLEDDYYKFTVDTSSKLKLNFKTNPNLDFYIYVMSSNKNISILGPDDMNVNGTYYEAEIYSDSYKKSPLAPGTYYLNVKVSGRNEAYGFSFNDVYPNEGFLSSYESSNDNSTQNIEFGKVYTASVIKGDDDERRVQVKLPKDGYIDIKLQRYFDTTGDEGDFYISLIGQDQITYIDKQSTSDMGNKTAEYNNIRIGLRAGIYNLSFEPSFYMNSGIATVNYSVDYKESVDYELEKNDTKITATTINTNFTYYGSTGKYLEDDYYKFTLNNTSNLKLSFKTNPNLDFSVYVLSQNDIIEIITPNEMNINDEYYDIDIFSDSYYKKPFGAGTYYLNVKVSGRNEPYEFRLDVVDKEPPIVTGVKDGFYYNANKSISFNEGSATLDGISYNNNDLVTAEGKHKLIVTDTAGNSTIVTFVIDKKAPVVSGVYNNAYYNINKTITFNEGTALLDGKKFNNNGLVTLEGRHTLTVTDNAGNKTVVEFIIDKTAPVIIIVNPIKSTTTTVTGKSEANALITVKIDSKVYSGSANAKGEFSISIKTKQKVGTKIEITAKDSAGNISKAKITTVVK